MSPQAVTHPLRILLVENHGDTRRILKSYLECQGHTVTIAATKAAAIEAASGNDCNVLISDIGLSDGNGWEILEQAQFRHPFFAIAMSGYGTASHRQKSVSAGFHRHMCKPFDLDQLDALLEEAVRQVIPAT